MKGEVVVEGVERERCSCSWYGEREGEVRLGECQTSEDDEERGRGAAAAR